MRTWTAPAPQARLLPALAAALPMVPVAAHWDALPHTAGRSRD
jgi:hypothetical protein